MFSKKILAQLVVATCSRYGIKNVVISPGSRNAPLTVGFSNNSKMQSYSIVDERCAAFFALGMAQQTQEPVALVCTSGSALLNYYPAIAEAFYSNIPLVVISADRPAHLIDIGDGQTIRQKNVFENHILYSANLEVDGTIIANNTLLCKALQAAVEKKGPVHINVPFDEPLYETVAERYSEVSAMMTNEVFHASKQKTLVVSDLQLEKFQHTWSSAKKKLVLIGVNSPDTALQEALNLLVEDPSVLVLTESTSNVYHPKFVHSIDQLIYSLSATEFEALQPDLLVTLGGMVVSKKIKQFLRKYTPKKHWHIDTLKAMDTYHCLSEFIQTSPAVFLKNVGTVSSVKESLYQKEWLQKKEQKEAGHHVFLANAQHTDLTVVAQVLQSIPKGSQLQLSNSSLIRYAQLFPIAPSVSVFCNRGTSGIDGSTSTAIGAAVTSKKATLLLTGDLSFLYDSNGLWNNYIPSSFRIVVVNNAGGGIFRCIPGPKTTNALPYFETPHQFTAEYLSKMYNFAYQRADDVNSLQNALTTFYKQEARPKILEVFTTKDLNDVVLADYFKSI